ncbi:MAG: hypothetical protein CVU95_08260 [Firmicutes bacterium HGW-Firmicutes-2]|jgi:hypothetical protein|nr:MAG: hypothetical protein CVU95_08260 [Firmicutes bacterium HGW-Firmicutes-2]
MAEISRFFDTELTAEGELDRVYPVKDHAEYFDTLVTTGVWADIADSLEVTGHGSQMKTIVATGKAFVKGYYYENDAPLELTHELPDTSQDRIDLIVLRLDLNKENRYIKAFVITGTPGMGSPELVLTPDVYEIALAEVLIIAGKSFIETSEVTDAREYSTYRTKPAWYPEGQVPMDAWMYVHFKEQLTAQEIIDIEANPSLMDVINSSFIVGSLYKPKGVLDITSSTTWTKPENAKMIQVLMWGGGGGGAAGDRYTSYATSRYITGGGGGGGGAFIDILLPASAFEKNLPAIIGAGGMGGQTIRANGNVGGDTRLGPYVAKGGVRGNGQSSGTSNQIAIGGAGGESLNMPIYWSGGKGGNSNSALGGESGIGLIQSGCGGGGGGTIELTSKKLPGLGGVSNISEMISAGYSENGLPSTNPFLPGGGGGGGKSTTNGNNAENGGHGGFPSAGGGGGGASGNTEGVTNGDFGVGGNGANGKITIRWW